MGGETVKLLTKAILKALPPLYANEAKPAGDVPVVVKFFTPWGRWTWYATEFDGEDTFFGLVKGHETELGYFSLAELMSVRGPGGLKVERDMWLEPGKVTLGELQAKLAAGGHV